MFLINFYQGKDMYNFKCLSLIIISLMLISCGGSTTETAVSSQETTTSSEETFGQSSFGTAKFN